MGYKLSLEFVTILPQLKLKVLCACSGQKVLDPLVWEVTMGAGNWTWVLWSSTKGSELLNCFSSLIFSGYEYERLFFFF